MLESLLAEGITVPMALVDFIPVALFFVGAVILQMELYYKLKKWGFACLAAGSIMVLAVGFYKALAKMMLACGVEEAITSQLSAPFFPMQGTGFMLVFLGLLSVYIGKDKPSTTLALSPVTIAFIAGQIIGLGGAQVLLTIWSAKLKKPVAIVCFVVSFIAMIGMGYLSAKFDDSSPMHWMAQLTNIVNTGAFLVGVLLLKKAGLKEAKL